MFGAVLEVKNYFLKVVVEKKKEVGKSLRKHGVKLLRLSGSVCSVHGYRKVSFLSQPVTRLSLPVQQLKRDGYRKSVYNSKSCWNSSRCGSLLPGYQTKITHVGLVNPLTPSVPIWHCLAKLSILILEGIIKKFPVSVATMSL